MQVLVTGNAGFIGFHVAKALLQRGDEVAGFDAVNDYYDPALKERRLELLEQAARATNGTYSFIRADIADRGAVDACFSAHRFDRVIHLAAQAGVRHSINNPRDYVHSNLIGFTNILEACRHSAVPHLTYASTSSVYGANRQMPFSEHHGVNHPLQFYAATKRANELMAHAYSNMFGLPSTGLRFFTVYGPWGRPDMALFLFTKNILEGKPIQVFNYGKHTRDFTYVDDIAEGVIRASDKVAEPDEAWDPMSGPRHVERTLPDLQHRQQLSRAVGRLYRGHRASRGPEGREGILAFATGGCSRHLRGCYGTCRGSELPASNPASPKASPASCNGTATTTKLNRNREADTWLLF